MDRLLLLFIVAGALVALLANIAVWAPRKLRLKVTALITTALFLPTAYVTLSDLMSRPKPVAIEWLERTLPEATVLSAQLREDVAIYLWLAMEGVEEPRAYALPWSEPLAPPAVRRPARGRAARHRTAHAPALRDLPGRPGADVLRRAAGHAAGQAGAGRSAAPVQAIAQGRQPEVLSETQRTRTPHHEGVQRRRFLLRDAASGGSSA